MLQGTRKWEGWYLEGLDKFFRDIHPSAIDPRGIVGSLDYVFESALFPLQRRQELTLTLHLANSLVRPETVMEIGADKGGGLYHWCLLPSVKRVIAAEIGGIPYNEHFEKAFPEIEFLWIPGSSYERGNVEKVRKFVGEKALDCLFIDGDKSAFERDFRTYRPMLSERSIVFTHDIHDDGPKQAFDNLAREFPSVKLVNTEDSVRAVVREVLGKPTEGRQEPWLRTWKGSSAGVGVLFTGKGYYES